MNHYKRSTQTPNSLFDDLLKILSESELKVLLTIIRKTIGQVNPENKTQRIQRAWISQRLFSICTGLSGRSVSNAIDSLVTKNFIIVTDEKNMVLKTKAVRRGAFRLYYESCLQLSTHPHKPSEHISNNPVKKSHTIKLNTIKGYSDHFSQGNNRLTDKERLAQIQCNTTNTRT